MAVHKNTESRKGQAVVSMNDYIKREDALRKIDSIDDHDDDVRANALGLAAFAVTTVPSADVIEVSKQAILDAGMNGQEVEFRMDGRLFKIREIPQ